jgi:hypothetical protein
MISYLSDKETFQYILPMLDVFKRGEYTEVLNTIKNKNINPNYSSNEISDFAALWLKEPEIIYFFKEIKKIGGNPIEHKSIFQNCLSNQKNKAAEYLIGEGVLLSCEDSIVYFINEVIAKNNLDGLDLLSKHIDISKVKLNWNSFEENPSCLNRAIENQNKEVINKLFKMNIVQQNIFNKESAEKLDQGKITQDFKYWFINNICKNLKLKNKKKYLSSNYEDGDITVTLKVMQYDILSNELKTKQISKKTNKI